MLKEADINSCRENVDSIWDNFVGIDDNWLKLAGEN
jgi:hypothetical protein